MHVYLIGIRQELQKNSIAANHALFLHFRTNGGLERPNQLGGGEKALENLRSWMILSGACKEEEIRKMGVRKEGVSQSYGSWVGIVES